jgi:hypothetical protein
MDNDMLGVLIHSSNYSTQEAKAEESQGQDQPGLHRETLPIKGLGGVAHACTPRLG